jgi:phosphate-selective porin OprO/OprP
MTLTVGPLIRRYRGLALVLIVLPLMTLGNRASGQDVPTADDMKARVEQLEKDLQALKEQLKNQTPAKPADKDKEAKDKPKDAKEEKKPEVLIPPGEDRKLTWSWESNGLRFKSANDDFVGHIGGRLMTDQVWWTQSPQLRAPAVLPANSPLRFQTGVGPGIGDLEDGFFVRRARFMGDGTIYRMIEFKVEFDFENYNNISFDESYVGVKNLPCFDAIRFGQTHVPFGLEAYTSSRFLPMIERSPNFDAFYQEFAPGIFTNMTFLDQRVTAQNMFHRTDYFSQFNGASFGDGRYAYSGRVSWLPIYECEGRELLHLGFAYQWRNASSPLDFDGGRIPPQINPAVTDRLDLIRFRSRQSLRDAVGLQGDNARVIDTGDIIADHVQSINGELMGYWGPLWVQSELCLAYTHNAFFPDSPAATPRGNLYYYGTYAQFGWLLTGENRGYDKRFGKYDRVKPRTNFFVVKDGDGCWSRGWGAWELCYRYGYVNLNDDFVQGGSYSEHTAGLNWYWNPNIKFQLNYVNGHRVVPPGVASGTVQGLGLQAALEF